jgi:hypothetical protein
VSCGSVRGHGAVSVGKFHVVELAAASEFSAGSGLVSAGKEFKTELEGVVVAKAVFRGDSG